MKFGLVLSGGGAKGSYEIGVWKALVKTGVIKNITSISGTSIGAMNAVLIAQGDIERAEAVWREVNWDFAVPSVDRITELIGSGKTVKSNDINLIEEFREFKGDVTEEIWRMVARVFADGILDREKLAKVIEDNIEYKKVRAYRYDILATSYNRTKECKEVFDVKLAPNGKRMGEYLLASAAIPGGYGSYKIDGQEYLDGGFPVIGENIPVSPLVERGVKNLIIVHLRKNEYLSESEKKGINNLIEIVPSRAMGDIFRGTMNFSQDNIKRNMVLGYADALYMLNATKIRICDRKKLKKCIEQFNEESIESAKQGEREIILIGNKAIDVAKDLMKDYSYSQDETKDNMVILKKDKINVLEYKERLQKRLHQ